MDNTTTATAQIAAPATSAPANIYTIQGGLRFVEDRATGELWFVARDVCDRLGTDAKDIPAILDWDEYRPLASLRGNASTIEGLNKLTGLRKDTRMLSEPGFYRLVFCSRKPEAVRFQDWVCDEVLPSIRKYGGYFTPPTIQRIVDDPDCILEIARKIITNNEARERQERLNQLFPPSDREEDYLTIDV